MSTRKKKSHVRKSTPPAKVVTYCRVSTDKQGIKGLGMEAQRQQLAAFVALHGVEVVGAFEEVETGKGGDALDVRPQLAAALALAEKLGATLLVAKLDRLSRSLEFIAALLNRSVEFFCLDVTDNSKPMIQMKAMMAEWERDMISERTEQTMAVAKAEGMKCGAAAWTDESGMKARRDAMNDARKAEALAHAESLRDDLAACAGLSLSKASDALAVKGHVTAKGTPFTSTQVQRLRERLGLVETVA